jgi:hypothetical protein
MIFRSSPALTNPGGILCAISGKTEKYIHYRTKKDSIFKKVSQISGRCREYDSSIFQFSDL